jgi:PAS domain S-box-containing protein
MREFFMNWLRRAGTTRWVGYVSSIAFVILVTIVRLVILTLNEPVAPFSLYLLPVVAAALIGGRGPGFLALVLGVVAVFLLLAVPSLQVQSLSDVSWASLAIFLIAGGSTIALADWLNRLRVQSSRRDIALMEREERIQAALKVSEEEFRTDFEFAPVGRSQADPHTGRLLAVNDTHCSITGYSRDEALRMSFSDFTHPDDRTLDLDRYRQMISGRTAVYESEKRYIRKDGSVIWVHVTATAVRDEKGRARRAIATVQDVSDRRKAEAALRELNETLEARVSERTLELAAANSRLRAEMAEHERMEEVLRQAQKMEAVGQLTGGLAHDFNNLLTVISGNLELLKSRLSDATLQRFVNGAQQAAERGAQLTTQLLAFSRRQRLELKPANLNEVIEGVHGLLQSTLGGTVNVQTIVEPHLWLALVDRTQIELIILNLAINARDAMPGGGTIVIETANVAVGAPLRADDPPAGEHVALSLRDTGTGISEEVLDKIFEPFFTTKEAGKGSGLGLSQVLGVVKQSGGGIRVDSRPGEGTNVVVYLPRAMTHRGVGSAVVSGAVSGRGACLLLVDDDSAVRATVRAMLEDVGHRVLEADGGSAALDIIRRERASIDAALLDFAMPRMNGAELARLIKLQVPALPILFITGFADSTLLSDEAGTAQILKKPFRREELAANVAKLLSSSPAQMKVSSSLPPPRSPVS